MSTFKNKLMATGTALGLLVSLSTTATAQNKDEKQVKRFDEIVVTARKRAENIQETPLAISAFTANMIESAGIRNMADLAKFTPGFTLDEDFGRFAANRPVIRGQSTIFGASGVSTFVDGILLNGSLLDYDLNDVERIEVIKGPQSALYGRNTYSGAINIVSKSPSDEFSGDVKIDAGSFSQFEAAASIRGPFANGVMSGGLTGRYYTRGGPFTNIYDNTDVGQQKSASLSGVLFYEPNDDLNIRTRLRYSKLKDDQLRNFNTPVEMNNIFQDVGGVYNGNFRYFQGEITARPINVDDARLLDEKGFDESDNIQGSISINYDVNENFSIEFLNGINWEGSRSKNEVGNTPDSLNPFSVYIGPVFPLFGPYFFHAYVVAGPVADFALDSEADGTDYSSELHLNYDGGQWQGMLGGYFYDGSSKSTGLRQAPRDFAQIVEQGFNNQVARMTALCAAHANDAGAPCFSVPGFDSILNFGDQLADLEYFADRSIFKSSRQNLAIFGSVNFDVTEQLAVSAEARYASEEVTSRQTTRQQVYDYLGAPIRFEESPEVTRNATFTSFNPRVTAKYQLNDSTNFYAIAAKGNKPGGFNGINVIDQGLGTYDEETVWSFEAGTKNTLMDGTLILNLSAYHNTISDYQLTQAVILPAINQTTSVITNLGKVRVIGLEAEMIYRVPTVPGLILNANYALADSEFTRGTDITEGRHLDTLDDGRNNCSIGLANPAAPCGTTGDNVLPGSIVGRALPRAPKHMFSVGMNYTRGISDTMDLVLNTTANYESKKYVQVHNLAYFGEALLVNGSIGLETDSMSITVWGRNLTNEDSVVAASRYIDEARSFQRAFLGTPRVPRSFGATVRKKF